MQLDLQQDAQRITSHLRKRVRDYPLYINEGPGKDEDPITQITAGFQFDQAGWLAVVFDTRLAAEVDGEWNSYIELNAIEFDHWQQALEEITERGGTVQVTLPSGAKKKLGQRTDTEAFAKCLGDVIRRVLSDFRRGGGFKPLPLAKNVALVVEEHDGNFGWTDRKVVEKDSWSELESSLDRSVPRQSQAAQVDYWIAVLQRLALGKQPELEWKDLVIRHVIERLRPFGVPAIVPLLTFVRSWATKPEWAGDRPERNFGELPMHEPTISALMRVHDSRCRTPEVESLLQEIMRRSLKVNASRRLWGIIPAWTARCLHKLFKGYPEPQIHSSTNELLNRDDYKKPSR
jgi:hypothetical protein